MRFDSVNVQNVQSIKSAELDFPARPGGGSFVTVVGPSSSGKSAFLRAVRALISNTSSASTLLRAGTKAFEVSAETTSGAVAIKRGASQSVYTVDGKTYTKCGTTAPDAATEVFGFSDPDLHVRFQFDRPYLLSETSGQAAHVLATLSNAHILRDASSEATKISRREAQTSSMLTDEVAQSEEELALLGDVDAQGALLGEAQKCAETVRDESDKLASLSQMVGVVEAAQSRCEAAQGALFEVPSDADPQSIQEMGVKADVLREAVSQVLALRAAVQQTPVAVPREQVDGILADLTKYEMHSVEILRMLGDVAKASSQVVECDEMRVRSAEEASTAEAALREAQASLQICPTCGQEVR